MVIEDLESVTYDWSGATVGLDDVAATPAPAAEPVTDEAPEAPETAEALAGFTSEDPDAFGPAPDEHDGYDEPDEPRAAADETTSAGLASQEQVATEAALPKVTTLPASPRDGALLLDLYISRYADELDWNVSHHRSILIMRAQAEEARLAKQYPNLDRLTIYVDGVPAGRMVVDCSETVFRLLDISLLPRFRGQGFASRLLGEMLGEARAARLRIRLEVPKSAPALRLFGRLGFGQPIDLGSTLRLTWTPPALEDDEQEPVRSREAHRGEPLLPDELVPVGYPPNGTGLLAVSD